MTYLEDVQQSTPTRFWVNNPTREDSQKAVDAGAIGVTTNPAFCSKLLQTEPDHIMGIIDSVVAEEPDNSAAAEKVYHQASKVLMDQWMGVYEESNGQKGFVTIQEDPRREEDHAYILEASKRAADLAPNYMAKVPVTQPGLAVIEELIALDIPICATEVFAISQYDAVLDLYEKASKKSGKTPPLYVTHITGIMDDYFKGVVKSEKIDVAADLLGKAGTVIGLHEYGRSRQREVAHRLIGGGARDLGHFANFVGSDMDITINWSTVEDLNANFTSAGDATFAAPSEADVQRLLDALPGFERAYSEDGLTVEEFADFGPVMLFRTQFMNGYSRLLDAVAQARRVG